MNYATPDFTEPEERYAMVERYIKLQPTKSENA